MAFIPSALVSSLAAIVLIAGESAVPEKQTPVPQQQGTEAKPNESLTEQLARSGGVVKPPPQTDPGMAKPAPDNPSNMPVIPPPGTPGGDTSVEPK